MLRQITHIDPMILKRLLELYAESMQEMVSAFESEEAMNCAYQAFLEDFIQKPGQLVLVEDVDGQFVSGLRAIECSSGNWYIEAVETHPAARRQGYGRTLLLQTIALLKSYHGNEAFCLIGRNNAPSIALHQSCGFSATQRPPINGWGEEDPLCALFAIHLT